MLGDHRAVSPQHAASVVVSCRGPVDDQPLVGNDLAHILHCGTQYLRIHRFRADHYDARPMPLPLRTHLPLSCFE